MRVLALLLFCTVGVAPLSAQEKPARVAIELEIKWQISRTGMERPSVFVDIFNPKSDEWAVYLTTAADYKVAESRGNAERNANWRLVVANPVSLPVGNYYFRVVTKGGTSTVLAVTIEKAGTVTLPWN